MLGSSIQTFAPSQEVGSVIHPDEAAEKELTSVVAENGTGLVGSLELEEEQPGITVGPCAGLGEGKWGYGAVAFWGEENLSFQLSAVEADLHVGD